MTQMLTAKEIQSLLQVDRSTIYRMAEAERLPAIKVGKQWRFPADQIESWLQQKTVVPKLDTVSTKNGAGNDLALRLPLMCVQLIQDTFAQTLGVMIVVTDMQGNPITGVSNPCGLFKVISQTPNAIQKCIENWTHLDTILGLEPQFIYSRLGLLGARGLVRIGAELKGMVIVGGIAPDDWPPNPDKVATTAAVFGLPSEVLTPHLHEVFHLDQAQQTLVRSLVQRIADILAQIAIERTTLTEELGSVAELAAYQTLEQDMN
jgi:excisionase family DNA binding protein